MSCEQLVCAHCAGPVVEGRCATCRAARAELHHHAGLSGSQLLLVLAVLAMLLTALLAGRGGF